MNIREVSFSIPSEATTASVSISGTSAQSVALPVCDVVVLPSVDCYAVSGDNPTATTACMPLIGGSQVRVTMPKGGKLAFITDGATGTVKLTPGV